MRRTATVLADGRELVYFDDVDRGRVPLPDRRALDPRPAQAELRLDPLSGEHVAVAAHRQTRTFLPSTSDCPLCPGSEIPDPAYDVAVFENRWPSFAGESGGDLTVAAGRCEVVAFADGHDLRFADLPPARVRTVVDAWADRTTVLMTHPDVVSVACFENRGEAIGVTLHHPHGQVYAYPFVPPTVAQLLTQVAVRPTVFDDVLAAELAGPRVIAADDHWAAYVPHAARWPYEAVVMPRRHAPLLSDLDEDQRAGLAHLLPAVLGAFDRVFGPAVQMEVPYIAAWRQSPRGSTGVRAHLRVTSAQRAPDKLKFTAGSESAYGVFINDVAPEDAAVALRAGLR